MESTPNASRIPCSKSLTSLILAASLMLGGCYSYTLQTGAQSDGVQHKARGSAIFWGLGGVNRMTECQNGLARARTYQPAWSIFVSMLTIGIITPWRSKYECAAGGQQPGVQVPGSVMSSGASGSQSLPSGAATPGAQPVIVPGQPAN